MKVNTHPNIAKLFKFWLVCGKIMFRSVCGNVVEKCVLKISNESESDVCYYDMNTILESNMGHFLVNQVKLRKFSKDYILLTRAMMI